MPLTGDGYLAGEYPGGTTTVEGVPVSATVRILHRPESGQAGDDALVAQVQSAPDGTWRVEGLRTDLLYDVVGRKEGFNDVIVANVTPTSMVEITYSGAVVENETFTGAVGLLELVGGIPPYSVAAETPFPSGLFPVVSGRNLIIDGTTGADEVASFDVKVTSSNGVEKTIPLQLVVGFKAPANLEAETIEDAGTFSVVLTWEVTNSTQEVLVFKSTTPFDLESMPAPIATLTGDAVSYTDDDVIDGDVFYYMAASVCEGFTLYSDEVREVVIDGDPHWENVVSLLRFDGDFTDETGREWVIGGSALISDGYFGGGLQRYGGSLLTYTDSLGLYDDTFTIEFWYRQDSNKGQYSAIFAVGVDNILLRVNTEGGIELLTEGNTYVGTGISPIIGEWYHACIQRNDEGILGWFVDGIYRGGIVRNPGNDTVYIGYSPKDPNDAWFTLDELRITKGVARYTENFIPPTKPFPNM